MRFINPSIKYWPQEAGMQGIWKQIARTTRVCYQSIPRGNEIDEDFVKKVILKPALIEGDLDDLEHCKFNFNKMHGSCLEHSTVYLGNLPFDVWFAYTKLNYTKTGYVILKNLERYNYVTTNMRVIIENNKWTDLQYLCKPSSFHKKRFTFSVITDIGITREMNRHKQFCVA